MRQDDMLKDDTEYVTCPFCDSKRQKKLFVGKDYLFSQREFTVVKCESCGLLFTNPRVREDKIFSYYFSDYSPYKETRPSRLFQKTKERIGRVFGNPHLEILQILQAINAKTVLEIGPGAGNLLFFLKEYGFKVMGIEMDINCVERIREKDIPCYLGNLNEAMVEIGSEKFDAIIFHHVFEHLYNPKETLRAIFNLLNEQGIIYLSMPNNGSVEAKLFGKYWRGLDLPRHIIHYDIQTMSAFIKEVGFKINKIETQIFPSSFIESLAFFFFKSGKMPNGLYYLLYYPWKLLSPIHTTIIGSGVMTILAKKE